MVPRVVRTLVLPKVRSVRVAAVLVPRVAVPEAVLPERVVPPPAVRAVAAAVRSTPRALV